MAELNKNGEVADVLSVDQFAPGRSAYECVAYSASLCKFAGQPNHGPTASVLQASNLAQYWYGREEGSNAASNTNGMSVGAEYDMLKGMGVPYKALNADVAAIKEALGQGYPVLLCGAETGMHDLDLGGRVPYGWTPTGNHAIVASGVASDGNLLVHDCGSIDPHSGVRPGPRRYDAGKMEVVSATAILVPWIQEDIMIDINTPGISDHFTQPDDHHWLSKATGKTIQYAMLSNYKQEGNRGLCGWDVLGDALSNEIELSAPYPKGSVVQFYTCGVRMWNSSTGKVTPVPLYDGGPGEDPMIAKLNQQLQAQAGNSADSAKLAQIKTIVNL